jgi:hypothetical protein
MFISVPPNAILAHYEQLPSGKFAVVGVSGKIIGSSFFELRYKYTATTTLSGAGCWVVLLPISQPTQPALF